MDDLYRDGYDAGFKAAVNRKGPVRTWVSNVSRKKITLWNTLAASVGSILFMWPSRWWHVLGLMLILDAIIMTIEGCWPRNGDPNG